MKSESLAALNNSTEEWKELRDFPKYSVSSFGRVRNDKTGKILKPFKIGSPNGQYYAVDFYPKKSVRVHRLVASAFIPNPNNKKEVNHIDGDHFNNEVKNLEWVTGSENCIHAYRKLNRKRFFGAENVTSKKVVRIEDGHVFNSLREAAEASGIKTHAHISDCLRGLRNKAGGYHWKYAEVDT